MRRTRPVLDTGGGSHTARDFTKTGPGALELSGTANTLNTNAARLPVLSVQDGTLRFASASAAFTNSNRPAGVNAVLGNFVLNVNEAGVFDLNGLATNDARGTHRERYRHQQSRRFLQSPGRERIRGRSHLQRVDLRRGRIRQPDQDRQRHPRPRRPRRLHRWNRG